MKGSKVVNGEISNLSELEMLNRTVVQTSGVFVSWLHIKIIKNKKHILKHLIAVFILYVQNFLVSILYLSSLAVPICTGPPVTRSASTTSAITRQAPASMRQMPEGIVWRTASTVLLLTVHMISDHQYTISGDTQSKYWPVAFGCHGFHRAAV